MHPNQCSLLLLLVLAFLSLPGHLKLLDHRHMLFRKKVIFYLVLIYSMQSYGQEIEKNQWKNRVLIILTNDTKNAEYNKQLREFDRELLNFNERKLIVYRVTPASYSIGLKPSVKSISSKLYKNYKKTKSGFEVILIGLDGGTKLRKDSLLTKQELYRLIDSMPMRKNEIKNNG